MKNLFILLVGIISFNGIAQHFQPVYTGNPYLPMNIYVSAATHPTDTSKYLRAGDEVGIFDDSICVGSKILTGPIPQGSPLAIVASADDPTTPSIDGFITGRIIKYRIWLSQDNREIPSDSITVTYTFGNSTFSTQGTSVVVLNSGTIPVELVYFTGTSQNGTNVRLEWATATETNNYGFIIERKINSDWSGIGFVEGNGNSTHPNKYVFVDDLINVSGETVIKYRLKQIDFNGMFKYHNEVEVPFGNEINGYCLYNNYPNPFNPVTRISFEIPVLSYVTLKVYDVIGNEVKILIHEYKEAGYYDIKFDASALSNGVYYYELTADNFRAVKKLILMK